MMEPGEDHKHVVLFLSSNGAGFGHLMRLMAIARRASTAVAPVIATLSQAVPVVRQLGFTVEYIPSHSYSDLGYAAWHKLLQRRLTELIATYDVHALVFDGTHPYQGLHRTIRQHPDLISVWSRRAMWKPTVDARILAGSDSFDVIVEPGEFASGLDRGPTVRRGEEVTRVGPILYLDPDELLSTKEAKAALGLDPDRPAALVQLGAGNINDTTSVNRTVLAELAQADNLEVCLAESAITQRPAAEWQVRSISVYPLARYLRAFDFAVSAAGYNSFHELVAYGIPTIFVPNTETQTDDQAARAEFAQRAGVGLNVREFSRSNFRLAIRTMMDPKARSGMAAHASSLFSENGAGEAMRLIEQRLSHAPDEVGEISVPDGPSRAFGSAPPDVGGAWPIRAAKGRAGGRLRGSAGRLVRWMEKTYGRMPDSLKHFLRPLATAVAGRLRAQARVPLLLVVLDPSAQSRIGDILDAVLVRQTTDASFRTLFVSFADQLEPFRRRGAQVEVVVDEDAWAASPSQLNWQDYVRARFASLASAYAPRAVVTVTATTELSLVHGVIDAMAASVTRGRGRR
jgi:UDP:flavonoid glycosyltransferase YjiC (YdhE family)